MIVKLDHSISKNIYKSYIVFSERCTLKKITVTTKNVKVINRYNLIQYLKKDFASTENLLSKEKIEEIHSKLIRFSRVDDVIKKEHIEAIKQKNI